tara:strand:- start:8641 stop:9291 length:651 start_codon:yes stop_codon:yes gene_type:complete
MYKYGQQLVQVFMIAIINHGLGNFASVLSAVKYLGFDAKVTKDLKEINNSNKIIIPGVGNYKFAMQNLEELNLIETLNNQALIKKKPILGICLGCQLLLNSSEEGGDISGLGWIDGSVKKFKNNKKFPITHVGWNEININKTSFLKDMPSKFLMYFNHSYYPYLKDDRAKIIGRTSYSSNFSSIFCKENIFGIQPHPEKSQKFGIQFLQNFLKNVS